MQKRLLVLLSLTSATSLFARESFDEFFFSQEAPNQPAPWFTGPLLTPSGHVVPEGHQNYEPYVYWTQNNGEYKGNWKSKSATTFNNVLYQMTFQIGIMPSVELDAAPQLVYNQTKNDHFWRASDLPLTLAFQLLKNHRHDWYPAIKLRFSANLPLGKYDHLNPDKHGTDVGGTGNWAPGVGLVFTRLHHITGIQYLTWRLLVNYEFSTPISVKDFNAYGGTYGTQGKVRPGNQFLILYGMEYSLTQRWVLALDFQYQHTQKRSFSGYTPKGTSLSGPSKDLFALAPAIEYNWNANLGVIAGPWFSFAGRNTGRFISYVIAINIYN